MPRDPDPRRGACHGPKTTVEPYRSGLATIGFRASFTSGARLCERPRYRLVPVAAMNHSTTATIFHNPACGTSRKTLEILNQEGVEVSVREYLKDPPSRDELKALYDRAGITPREGLRSKEPIASELGLTGPDVDDDAILDAMAEHPILINRPLVATDKGVRLCRPQEKVREIL